MAKDLKYRATLDTSNFKKGMEESMNQTKKLEDSLGGLSSKIAGGVGVAKLAEMGFDMIKEFGKGVMEATANYEKFSARLSTLLGGNKEEAEALHTQLVELSSSSGIKLSDLEESTIQLNLFGVAAGKTKQILERFGNISVATGIDTKTLSEQYGRIVESGSLTSRTLKVFQKEGINLQAQLQKDLGLSAHSFDKLLKAGKITAEEVNKAFEDMTTGSGKFAGQMDAYGKTINGQLNRISTGFEELEINIGKSKTGIISLWNDLKLGAIDYANESVKSVNRVTDALDKFGGSHNRSFWEKIGGNLTINKEIEYGKEEADKYSGFESGGAKIQADMFAQIRAEQKSIQDEIAFDIGLAEKEVDENGLDLNRKLAIVTSQMASMTTLFNTLNKKAGDKTNLSTVSTPEEKEKVKENITINIGKLVETIALHTVTLKEGVDEIQKIIADAIQQAVYGIKLNYK